MVELAFAQALKKLRLAKKFSQEEFASQANLHRTYVSQLERGLKSPSLNTIYKICLVLGIKMSEFMQVVEEELNNVYRH